VLLQIDSNQSRMNLAAFPSTELLDSALGLQILENLMGNCEIKQQPALAESAPNFFGPCDIRENYWFRNGNLFQLPEGTCVRGTGQSSGANLAADIWR